MQYFYIKTILISTLPLRNVSTKDYNCVYASVNGSNKSHLLNISSQIMNYEENIQKRNLLIVDLKPYYESALIGDLTPFKELELQLRQELVNRGTANNNDVLIIADCAVNLFMNQRFDQC